MPIWKTTSVTETPQILLIQWRIRELPDGDRHFVGYNISEGEGRVSSAIIEFDSVTRRGKTRSGRVYQLVDEPGVNSDADYVWSRFLARYKISHTDVKEVTDEYISVKK